MVFWLTPAAWAEEAQPDSGLPAGEQMGDAASAGNGPQLDTEGAEPEAEASEGGSAEEYAESTEASDQPVRDAEIQALLDEAIAAKQAEPEAAEAYSAEAEEAAVRIAESEAREAELMASLEGGASVFSEDAEIAASSLTVGGGTAEDPYVVSSAEELAAVADDVAAGIVAHYMLAADVDLRWTLWSPIGTAAAPFKGVFDGAGHTVSGLLLEGAQDAGLFGAISGATVKDLTISDSRVVASGMRGAVAVSSCAAGSTVSGIALTGCALEGSGMAAGGVVGLSNESTVSGCTNDGSVSNTDDYTGGVVGWAMKSLVTGCTFTGTVDGRNCVGGVMGSSNGNSNLCTNAGAVRGNGEVGGIIGEQAQSPVAGTELAIENCYNSGSVEGASEVGGVAGLSLSSSDKYAIKEIFRGVGNSGSVSATGSYAGGAIGRVQGCTFLVAGYNAGPVSGDSYVGGMVGKLSDSYANFMSALSGTYSSGYVQKASYAGMIVGYNQAVTFTNNYYLTDVPSGFQAGPWGGGRLVTPKPVNTASLRSLAPTLGGWFAEDADFINNGFPILAGANYVEATEPPDPVVPRPEEVEADTEDEGFWADPVDASTGAQTAAHTLLDQSACIPFALELSYDGSRLAAGEVGRGWHHNYEMRLETADNAIRYYASPSSYIEFQASSDEGVYATAQPGKEQWSITQLVGGYLLSCGDGQKMTFDIAGALTGIEGKTGDALAVSHASGSTTVTDQETGRSLVLTMADGLLASAEARFGDATSATASFAFANGSLSSVTDENGCVWSYSYDADGRMLTASDPSSHVYLSNVYDAHGRVVSQDEGIDDGKATLFTYSKGKDGSTVVVVVDREGNDASKTFDASGLLTASVDRDGVETSWLYDASGNVVGEIGWASGTATMSYDASGNLLSRTDAAGAVSSWTYDAAGNMLTYTDPAGAVTTNAYDAQNRLTSTTDPAGTVTTYDYGDNVGPRPATRTVAGRTYSYTYADGLMATANEAGLQSAYAYDARGRLASETDAAGNAESYSYDAAGRLVSHTDREGSTTSYAYDFRGNLLTSTDGEGGVTSYEYDANGNLSKETNAAGGVTTYTRDAEGRVVKAVDGAGRETLKAYTPEGRLASETDGLGNVTSYSYDAAGNLASRTLPSGAVTSYAYDAVGRVVSETDPAGGISSYSYDAAGRLAKATDPLGAESIYEYDALGNLTAEKDALGNRMTYEYDAFGDLVKRTDPNGSVSEYSYDTQGRLASSTEAGVTLDSVYDSVGNLSSVKNNATDKATAYAYDKAGRLLGTTDAAGGASSRVLDANGRATSVVNPLGGASAKAYDAAGRVTGESTPSAGSVAYAYDGAGNLATLKNARGDTRTFSYDAAGRLSGFADGDGTTTYAYDADGNLASASHKPAPEADAQTVERQHDSEGRVVSSTDANGAQTSYAYDAAGNLASITYPGGDQVLYTYDAAGRMTKVEDWAGRVTTYSYDAAGNLVLTSNADGSSDERTYNAGGKLAGLKSTAADGTVIAEYALAYDADGNVLTETSVVDGVKKTCTYDSLGRLVGQVEEDTTAGTSVSSHAFAYDAAGNVTSSSSTAPGSASRSMAYDDQNRLSALDGEAAAYDADGNMTGMPTGDGSATLAYDEGNRLMSFGSTAYAYDALDNRVTRTDASGTTTYSYDAGSGSMNLLSSTAPDGETTRYVHGMGLIGSVGSDGAFHTHHYDLRGSTVAVTGADGAVTDRYSYGPYGGLASHDGQHSTPFLYNGLYGVMDDGDGLLYMRARYYSTELMRFVNADVVEGSLATPATLNRYAYANGNPVSYLDPFGRSAAAANAGHAVLDGAGFIPVAGAVFDVANGVWYAGEGDWANAGLSLLGAIPAFGDAASAGKVGVKALGAGADALSAAGKGAKAEKAAKLSMTAREILAEEKGGKVLKKFPSQWLDSTLEEITAAAKQGDRTAQSAKKLLTDNRFNKADNRK